MSRLLCALLALLAGTLCLSVQAQQTVSADAWTPQQIAARIHSVTPKTVVLVFDVSGSTRSGGVFGRERAAAAAILRAGCVPGDRAVLYAFGTGFQTVFDKTIASPADASALVELLPATTAPGAGTNIRLPHAQALQTVKDALPHPGVIVLLTDSFNDRPLPTDPNYPDYLDYYSLQSLTTYPNTSQNRAYERLLRELVRGGKVRQYGIGVGIAASGRPIERLPLVANRDASPGTGGDLQPTVLTPVGTQKPAPSYAVPIGAGVLVLAIAATLFFLRSRPVPLRLRLGEKSVPRDFLLRPGQSVQIGGTSNPQGETFPLAGATAAQAAVSVVRGALVLTAADGAQVFHNGARVQEPMPLKAGDEVRVSLPASDTDAGREHRLRVEDPRGAGF